MKMMIVIQFDPQHLEAMSALIAKEQECYKNKARMIAHIRNLI